MSKKRAITVGIAVGLFLLKWCVADRGTFAGPGSTDVAEHNGLNSAATLTTTRPRNTWGC